MKIKAQQINYKLTNDIISSEGKDVSSIDKHISSEYKDISSLDENIYKLRKKYISSVDEDKSSLDEDLISLDKKICYNHRRGKFTLTRNKKSRGRDNLSPWI